VKLKVNWWRIVEGTRRLAREVAAGRDLGATSVIHTAPGVLAVGWHHWSRAIWLEYRVRAGLLLAVRSEEGKPSDTYVVRPAEPELDLKATLARLVPWLLECPRCGGFGWYHDGREIRECGCGSLSEGGGPC
jgi:hypothetical protein